MVPMPGMTTVTTDTDAHAAVGRAAAAFRGWADTPMARRREVVRRFGDLVAEHATPLAETIVDEMGKLRADAAGEVAWTVDSAYWYADRPPLPERVAGAVVAGVPLPDRGRALRAGVHLGAREGGRGADPRDRRGHHAGVHCAGDGLPRPGQAPAPEPGVW